nr:hypothetical protein Iba_chr01dCG11300 [Ipomoea batatas]
MILSWLYAVFFVAFHVQRSRHHHQLQALLKPHQTRAKYSLERMQYGVQNLHTNLSGEEQEPCSQLSVAPPRSSANTSRVPQSAAEGLFASISFEAYAKQQDQKKAEPRAYRTWKNEKIGSEVAEHEKRKKRNYIDWELEKLLAIVLYIYAKNQTSYAALSLTSNHLPATVVLIPQMIHYEYQIRWYNKIRRLHLPVQSASQTHPRARSYLGDAENSPLRQDSEANRPSSFSTDPIVAGEALKVLCAM